MKIVGQNGDCVVLIGEDENPASATVGRAVAKKVRYFTSEERAKYRSLVTEMNNSARDSHEAYIAACRRVDAYVESFFP